jgi:hypothetical protein
MKDNLVTADSAQFNTLQNGDPISLRTKVSLGRPIALKNGERIKVVCDDDELDALIISDPILVIERPEDSSREVSIEVRRLEESDKGA